MQKGHIKCTVAQKEAHWPPFLVFNFNLAICVDIKNILYKKSLIDLITGTNLLKVIVKVWYVWFTMIISFSFAENTMKFFGIFFSRRYSSWSPWYRRYSRLIVLFCIHPLKTLRYLCVDWFFFLNKEMCLLYMLFRLILL